MGMFDYVKCEYPLPDGFVPDKVGCLKGLFQTKSFPYEERFLLEYRITPDGRLMRSDWHLEYTGEVYPQNYKYSFLRGAKVQERIDDGETEVPYDGELRFTYVTEAGDFKEYVATFDKGQLQHIEQETRI